SESGGARRWRPRTSARCSRGSTGRGTRFVPPPRRRTVENRRRSRNNRPPSASPRLGNAMKPLASASILLPLLLSFPSCMGIGKAGADLELEEPALGVALETDAASYGVGAAIVATVTVTNEGPAPVSIPRPSSDTVRFFLRSPGETEPRD